MNRAVNYKGSRSKYKQLTTSKLETQNPNLTHAIKQLKRKSFDYRAKYINKKKKADKPQKLTCS